MSTILDQPQRQEALDPTKSFIVQAPAGSGKTELLTQRYLVLLSHVKQPEEILAITFTKKSSAEMRARIINALINAAATSEPEASHAKTTWKLAKSALQRHQTLEWKLLENPNRLRIQTIDSFNAYLTKQLPILSHFGAPPEITEDPSALYRSAVQEFLMHIEDNTEWSEAIARLLLHLDNDIHKVQKLLINLLKNRDQWLPYITANASEAQLRHKLESYLAKISTQALLHLKNYFPNECIDELISLAHFAAVNLIKDNSSSSIKHCTGLTDLPDTASTDKLFWLGLIELMLTKEGEWRKQFTKATGFPAASSTKNPTEKLLYDTMKQRMAALVNILQSRTELLPAMREIRLLPDCQYQESQWQVLEALHQVLCVVAAYLKLTFQQNGKIDYIESAQAALAALGTGEAPTDITLALDYQIQHVLVDEFQDTSNSQYRLIEKLTAGWFPQDGRTLFLVGDPMQSIYRFREAEVGYFIRTQQEGLNQIHLIPLTLSVNFRSVPGIVEWVNYYFPHVLPSTDNIGSGAVSYSPSIAANGAAATAAVKLHAYINTPANTQAENIAALIQQLKMDNPHETIAILVRSRTHLSSIISALKKASISFKAIDIDSLGTRPIIRDLMALTCALLHPADRIAWLAILRAPWCGLTLSDLVSLTKDNLHATLWEQLQNPALLQHLSDDGQQRLARILPILRATLADRQRYGLRAWLESAWLLLGGPACTAEASDLADAETYFYLLEKLDKNGELLNIDELEHHVSRLFAAPDPLADNSLQIMTIHNAKGLEFDTVILPHLERKPPSDDKSLLLWMERPSVEQENALLIAPLHAADEKSDSIYDYIKWQHAIKTDYEVGRLLYVAATRAKKRLHLFFSLHKEDDRIRDPAPNSLLAKLWPAIGTEIIHHSNTPYHEIDFIEHRSTSSLSSSETKSLHRLTLEWVNPINETDSKQPIAYHRNQSGFQLLDHYAKYIGTFIHQLLQQLCLQGPTWWEEQEYSIKVRYCENQLLQLGVLPHQLATAVNTVLTAINNTLQDQRGRWIIQAHQEAKNEFPLTIAIDNQIKSLVIDRTFIDEAGTRWIIDFKTTAFYGNHLQAFLKEEQSKHTPQLSQYAKAISALEQRRIRLGLYWPLLPGWQEWVYDPMFGS